MEVEIITIGDEILTGHTIDSNSAFIAQHLTGIGLSIKYISSCGDSVEQMEEAFRLALKRAQVVITTGGLGPTDDDNTKKAIVKVFKRNLIFHEEILEDIKARYAKRGIDMPGINQNQALLPQGAMHFPNRSGSAVGICITENGRTFISLPGVPHEMKQIMADEVVPHLRGLPIGETIKIIKLRTTGIIESRIAEMLMSTLKLESGVKLAYLPSVSGVDLRIMSYAPTEEEALEKARAGQRMVEAEVGKYIYGREDDTLEGVVGQLLKDNDKTVSVAESCTGGGIGALLTSVPGSSDYFEGGVISYSNDSKIRELGIDPKMLEEHGSVAEECAAAMASGCRLRFGTDYALSITGVAGPTGGTDDKPVGLTFIGLASAHATYARKFHFGNNRETNRLRAAYSALELLRRDILDIT